MAAPGAGVPTYEYLQLSPGRHIRVLDLHPALFFRAPIQCSIREISLEERPVKTQSYDALSYVWGSPRGDQPILCNGATVLVTPNCLAALRYLRFKWQVRTLWVDSICINQESEREKSHQVQLMGDVYKLANRVLIWLGHGSSQLSGILRRFKFLGMYLAFTEYCLTAFPLLGRLLARWNS